MRMAERWRAVGEHGHRACAAMVVE
jgi:hypothetical protein